MTDLIQTAAQTSKAWPFEEARKLIKRFPGGKRDASGELVPVLFETGYGPSGLPHIGTFQEVLRTTLVRRAYEVLTGGHPTRLVAFSDDMDGLRKVPDNVPNKALLDAHLGHPLSRIPDPFEKFESFAHHNNAMLRDFLDRFGFDYEFVSASDRYNAGGFDEALKNVLRNWQAIMDIMLPTLREERRKTYSPVLPVSPTTGEVLQGAVEVVDAETGIVRFTDSNGEVIEHTILGGWSKLQWKVDWAMRWVALGVDYEMCGKDLTDSVTQSGKIARVLGGHRPEGLIYELFLDEKGEKISKSKGNGLTIEQWLEYGSEESLGFYLFREPKSAKSLHVGIIPRAVDEYWQFREKLPTQPVEQQLGNPVWHLLSANGKTDGSASTSSARADLGSDTTTAQPEPVEGHPLPPGSGDKLAVTYGLLLNLVGVLGAQATREQVWSYLANYVEDADPAAHPALDTLVTCALAYNRDFIAPTLQRRKPEAGEALALAALDEELAGTSDDATAEELQNIVYEIGKDPHYGFESLRDWFKCLYETLLGSSAGPRMGSFIALYGIENTRKLIAEALD
ncbi:MAG: lysine--tRNA ligase [Novosphingobium sp. 28-62-57]|uniref:lysine--tRNA ligase n=1 Tax=unclassified Novosphingobium TaxID=2644732 RepID=UPI000BD3C061|nr:MULTISPECIES: lysine--tRNA ligase [unclassified Novosphingobium]OYW50038.1 MAG: lysine--tRNA ligase [Novosphingobium sp. 12-62-10]OYZ12192.1 MAG: lysine--tRNA ligase [Novosphingobium sp. 28-62-57]OZA36077.1 MAG: lysine--tRNA ligase [Novosphingobium sp. 17-62-9]